MHSGQPNGVHNGVKVSRLGSMDPETLQRPFSVHEALPFSPQTSTIPFLPDIIPDPSLGSGSPALRVSDLFSREDFDRLNAEAANQVQSPKGFNQALDQVLRELKPSQRTHYNFAAIPPPSTSTMPSKSLRQDLTPVTRSVYDRVGKMFKTTKPQSATPARVNGKAKSRLSQGDTPSTAPTRDSNKNHDRSSKSNHRSIEVSLPAKKIDFSSYVDGSSFVDSDAGADAAIMKDEVIVKPLPQPETSEQALQMDDRQFVQDTDGPRFNIELFSADIDRSEYLEVANAPDAPSNLSVRRKDQQDMMDSQGMLAESLNHRQRSEAALDALSKLTRSIFSAVGHVLGGDSNFEHLVMLTPEQEATMTAASQQKMYGAIQKVIALKCFDQVPTENLLQIMKLSEGSMKQADALELRVNEDWDEQAFDQWMQQLPEVETSLKAGRTCLLILSGGREDKQLYSEGVISRIVDIFRSVIEDIVTPVAEIRNTGPGSNTFKMLAKQKKIIAGIFSSCQKLFSLLAELVTKIELSDTVINTLEYTASKLVFVENAFLERESAIGVQKFDGIRSVSMDMLSQIFLVKPEQRTGIIDDILTSLEKLPVGRQTSRQFRLPDGGSLQPVSALLMRLVQASSGKVDPSRGGGRPAISQEGDDELSMEMSAKPLVQSSTIRTELAGAEQHKVAIQDLEATASPLIHAAQHNAAYIINFMVQRAIGSSKSGDSPYRNLLDLFVEDFMTCLDSSDWPSAELLLRQLTMRMIQLFEGAKTAAPTKNMALEILGNMVAAISRLRSHVAKLASSLDGNDADDLSKYLADLASHMVEQRNQPEPLVAWTGPYRAVLEFLQTRSEEDQHLSGAISLLMADWATWTHTIYDNLQDDEQDRDQELGRLAFRLRMMLGDRQWLATEYTFKKVTAAQAKLSYAIALVRSPLNASYNMILRLLLNSLQSDQVTVRSRSLKSFTQVIETDPIILDKDSGMMHMFLECARDVSPQVRDSALGLLSSCINVRPRLEELVGFALVERLRDTGLGVRKRAMKLARDIYVRNRSKEVRSALLSQLLPRIRDPDDSVCDLARQMIEEIWFAPFYNEEDSATYQTALAEHTVLIVRTVQALPISETLSKVFQTILQPGTRLLEGPASVCKKVVANLFSMIDNPDPDESSIRSFDALQVLVIFAKAEPTLFNFEQIRLLKPQLLSWGTSYEVLALQAVCVIYRLVLPSLPTRPLDFLQDIIQTLNRGLGKINNRGAFSDLVACIKVCCSLRNNFQTLGAVASSSLLGIANLPRTDLTSNQGSKLRSYALIAGMISKHYDLDQQIATFRGKFPRRQFDTVPRLMIDVLSPWAAPEQPLEFRNASIEAIGLVCQESPRNYGVAKVYTSFQQAFQDREIPLEASVLRSFRGFLFTEEKRSEMGAAAPGSDKNKELTVMGGTNFDDVASAVAQRFLKDITRIALGSQDDHAFLAMEVLGSINRQGLTHPKETGVTLITLETSSNKRIADLAFTEHRSLHEKHETVLEREYVKAVQSAYNYQRDIVKDLHGATIDPFQSKLYLLMDVLKISKMKNRQRFLEKLAGQVDFDLTNFSDGEAAITHINFARFIIENIAYFEYQTIGELQTVVSSMEKIVTSTGATVAQAVEAELLNMRMDLDSIGAPEQPGAVPTLDTMGGGQDVTLTSAGSSVEPGRLLQLTAGSVILLCLWEARTHLRRLYGMGTHRHDSKAKGLAKDLNKTPLKTQNGQPERCWDEIEAHVRSLQVPQEMVQKCRALVELLNVDKEFRVADDDDEMGLEDPTTPSEGGADSPDRGRKRKGDGTPGGRKKRPRSNSQPRKRGRPRKVVEEVEDEDADGDWII